ncbi:hypothetical protein ES708_23861 [subsurface metagenome]
MPIQIESPKFTQLIEKLWNYLLANDMTTQLMEGKIITSLPPITETEIATSNKRLEQFIEELLLLDSEDINEDEHILVKSVLWNLRNQIERSKYFLLDFPLCPYSFPYTDVANSMARYNFSSEQDIKDYLPLIGLLSNGFKKYIDMLHQQEAKGITIPSQEIPAIIKILQIFDCSPTEHPFYIKASRLGQIGGKNSKLVESFLRDLESKIKNDFIPNVQNLIEFLSTEYQDKSNFLVGLGQYPQGKDYYRFLCKFYTNLAFTPEEIHEIGLQQLKQIVNEISQMIQGLVQKDNLSDFFAVIEEFPELRDYFSQDMQQFLYDTLNEIEPLLTQQFLTIPPTPFSLKPLPSHLAESMTFGYYQTPFSGGGKGTYYFNEQNKDPKSMIRMRSIIYHEIYPGHHLQMATVFVSKNLPRLFRGMWEGAFVEGWAEYATDIASELGLMTNPLHRLSRLIAEKFFSLRLIVDTGLNYFDWGYEKTFEFLKSNDYGTDKEIKTEILRYAVDLPGQALSYRMGYLEFKKLRRLTQEKLGEKFDLRKYHDQILKYGAIPLPILANDVLKLKINP